MKERSSVRLENETHLCRRDVFRFRQRSGQLDPRPLAARSPTASGQSEEHKETGRCLVTWVEGGAQNVQSG